MLSEAYQRVATLQLGSIAIFAALSSAMLKSERAFTVKFRCLIGSESD